MENKRLKAMYNCHLDDLVAFSDKADYLTEQSKREFLGYKIKEFKEAIDQERKRDAFVRKGANKLYKATLKAMKQELKKKAKQRKLELAKLAVYAKYGRSDDIQIVENFANCDTCANRIANDKCDYCCGVYNLAFGSDELRNQFCACYCTEYKKFVEEQSDEVENATEEKEPTDDTTTPPEDKTPDEVTNDEPKCCKECDAYIDGDDGCYCNKYGKYLNDNDVDNVCCCENDDFFEEEEDDDE